MRGLPIGYSQNWRRLRYEIRKQGVKRPGESSGILFGPARVGKGTDLIVPMLLEYEGSVICLDVKGQNACITAEYRRKRLKQNVVLLNPFNEWPRQLGHLHHGGMNPLQAMHTDSDDFPIECDSLGESVVPEKPKDPDSHFTDGGQQTVSGTAMVVALEAQPERRNLASVYEIISGPHFFEFARDAMKLKNSQVAGRLGRFAAPGASENRELISILSTAIQGCRFIGNPAIMRNLSGEAKGQPALDWKELRKRPTTVYIILPVRFLKPLARWLRLCINACLNELLVEEQKGLPTLLLMDEFAAVGHLSMVEASMALSAGMGLTMLPVLQDAGQLRDIYGESRMHSFMSMAGYQLFLTPRDLYTARIISDLSGQSEVTSQSRSVTLDPRTGEPHVSDSGSQQPIKVYQPDQVMALGSDQMLARVENVPDIICAKRRPYYASPEYRGMWAPDPYHVRR